VTTSFPDPGEIATLAVIDWHDRLGRPAGRYRSPFAHPTRMMPILADYLNDLAVHSSSPSPEGFYHFAADRMPIALDDVRTGALPVDDTVTYHYRVAETVDFGSAPTDPNRRRAAPRTLHVVVQVRTPAEFATDPPRTCAPWSVLMRTYTTGELYVAAGTVLYHQGMYQHRCHDAAGTPAEAAELIARAAAYTRLGKREERTAR
jgi:hypothetical protein